jgi:hypothetical protein
MEHHRHRGRCADCYRSYERAKNARRRQQLPTRIRDTQQWKDARAAARARDGGCVYRHQGDCEGRIEVHHRVSLERGGAAFDLRNLVALCRRHHSEAEGRSPRA